MKKWSHLSNYHVYFQSYGHWNVKIGSFFVFSVDNSKQLVTIWAKQLSPPLLEFFSENGMVNSLCGYASWDNEGKNIRKADESTKYTKTLYFQGLTSC